MIRQIVISHQRIKEILGLPDEASIEAIYQSIDNRCRKELTIRINDPRYQRVILGRPGLPLAYNQNYPGQFGESKH